MSIVFKKSFKIYHSNPHLDVGALIISIRRYLAFLSYFGLSENYMIIVVKLLVSYICMHEIQISHRYSKNIV